MQTINVTGGMLKPNGTTSVPKPIPHLMLDKVRLTFSSEMKVFFLGFKEDLFYFSK